MNTFDWNPAQFPEPQKMIDRAHDLGFGFALWHTPYLDKKAPETEDLRTIAEQNGYFPPATSLPLNPWGKLIDLTNPDAYSWWQGYIINYTSMGVEGFKLDYAEDVVPGLTAGRNVWQFADGSDERTMHGRYQLFYHRAYQDLLPASGGFLLCRHGTYGDQQNVSVIWPGDLDASFAKNGEATQDQKGDKYVAVGGLPAALIAGLSLGPSGFPFFGADTGGYLHSPPDKELFVRWFEQTALSTVMQIGNSASTVAWEPDAETGFDAEMLDWYRTYTRLHLRLYPYEWTYAKNLAKDGRPIARPLGLAYPELGQHPDDVYLFGDSLLVAPVVARGVTSRSVPMPPGRWVDWWTGEVVEGGKAITADAPLWKLPLWLAEGGIVPMLRPTIDTLRPTTKPSLVDSYVTDPGVLWVRVAPGPASSFTVFDGSVITQERAADRVKLSASDGKELDQRRDVRGDRAGEEAVTGDRRRDAARGGRHARGAGAGGVGVDVGGGRRRDGLREDAGGDARGGDRAVGLPGHAGARPGHLYGHPGHGGGLPGHGGGLPGHGGGLPGHGGGLPGHLSYITGRDWHSRAGGANRPALGGFVLGVEGQLLGDRRRGGAADPAFGGGGDFDHRLTGFGLEGEEAEEALHPLDEGAPALGLEQEGYAPIIDDPRLGVLLVGVGLRQLDRAGECNPGALREGQLRIAIPPQHVPSLARIARQPGMGHDFVPRRARRRWT
ncbi:MAG: glycoside hydrolase family 31 protein [Minicystis sp.]